MDEIALVSPTIELVQNPDGSSNLDPLLKALQAKPSAAKPAQPAKPSKPLQIDLRLFTLSDATIVKIQNHAGGQPDLVELTNVNLTLTNLQNGQTARLQLEAALRVAKNPPAAAGGSLEAGIKGEFQFALTPDLKLGAVTGNTHLDSLERQRRVQRFLRLQRRTGLRRHAVGNPATGFAFPESRRLAGRIVGQRPAGFGKKWKGNCR